MNSTIEKTNDIEDILNRLFIAGLSTGIIITVLVRDNHRNKKYDFIHKHLVPAVRTEAFAQEWERTFSGTITYDSIENRVTAWDYDEDTDQAAAEKFHLHETLTKILS